MIKHNNIMVYLHNLWDNYEKLDSGLNGAFLRLENQYVYNNIIMYTYLCMYV